MNGHAPLFQLNFTFDKSEMSEKENILKAEEQCILFYILQCSGSSTGHFSM